MRDAIFDSQLSKDMNLEKLIALFKSNGANRIIYKRLSPNDNSKNQPYMGNHLTNLSFIPTGEIQDTKSDSKKISDPKRKIKYLANLEFNWMDGEGRLFEAPNAKLIYYPQYPEVRLSGFLQGCSINSGGWMDPKIYGRDEGRVLLFGINSRGVIAFLAIPDSNLAREIEAVDENNFDLTGIFKEITIDSSIGHDSKVLLLEELKRIHLSEWIDSKRLNSDGNLQSYLAQNGGGYTLEAELGIKPNGDANPDFYGWEVKQFAVNNFAKIGNKALTLMTPEPNGGVYVDEGVERFVLDYGYTKNDGERYDFTGIHNYEKIHARTGLKLILHGYDYDSNTITKADGFVGLITAGENIAGSWSFAKLIGHWKRKHAKAVYVPSMSRM
ncbi:MAG: hypothetical protein C0603_06495 [Denitrovibrio sp.]|nr:MAG: hypothetical protein C0603_06495 [Denitrovibrio sp.]